MITNQYVTLCITKKMGCLVCLVIIFGLCLGLGKSQNLHPKPQPTPFTDWDYLVFTQRWPITSCAQWEEAKKDNTCNLPKNKSLWTIHGIWPTKIGKEGPFFCPSSIHFDPDQLTPIMDDLKTYWINVEANTKPISLWAHEWDKHGTCAVVLPQLDSVTNYFIAGLKLTKLYDLSRILANGGIVPNNMGYSLGDINTVVKNAIKVDPTIQCVIDKKTKESFISEIRICFNKSLELIDCDQTGDKDVYRTKSGILTNCNAKKQVWYLSSVPNYASPYEQDYNDMIFQNYQEHYEKQQHYNKVYKFLKFISWFTL